MSSVRLRLVILLLALAAAPALAPSSTAAPPFKAVLEAPTHTPRTNTKWRFEVRATDLAGKPIRAKLTAQVIDPFGLAHPVEYDGTHIPIVNRPFFGIFRDYAIWPPESRGFRVTFKAIVAARGAKIVLRYAVTPR